VRLISGGTEIVTVVHTEPETVSDGGPLCPGPAALRRYLTTRLALDAVTSLETAPVPRTLKGAGPLPT
jgi:hypothetical protein